MNIWWYSHKETTVCHLCSALSSAPVCLKTADGAVSSIPKSGVSARAQDMPPSALSTHNTHKHHTSLLFKQTHGYEATEVAEGITFKLTRTGSTQTTYAIRFQHEYLPQTVLLSLSYDLS